MKLKIELTLPQVKILISASESLLAGDWGEGDSYGFTNGDANVLERASEKLKECRDLFLEGNKK